MSTGVKSYNYTDQHQAKCSYSKFTIQVPGGAGYSTEFLVGVCCQVLQCNIPIHVFSPNLWIHTHFQIWYPNQTFRPKQSKSISIFKPKSHTPWGSRYLYSLYRGIPSTPPPGPLGFKCPYFKSSISPTDLLIERNREVGGRLWWWGEWRGEGGGEMLW